MASSSAEARALADLEDTMAPLIFDLSRRRLRRAGWTQAEIATLTAPWLAVGFVALSRVVDTAVGLVVPDEPDWDSAGAGHRDPAIVTGWVHALLTLPDAAPSNFALSLGPERRWPNLMDVYSQAVGGAPDLAVLAARAGLTPEETNNENVNGNLIRADLVTLAALRGV